MLHEYPVVKYKTITRVRSGDEPLMSGEEEAQRMNGILRNLWWSITMIGRCSICLVYNSGWLVLEGVNKTVQESLASEHLDSGGVFPVLVLPVVPFITKFNRYIVLGLLVVGKFGNNFGYTRWDQQPSWTGTRSIMLDG